MVEERGEEEISREALSPMVSKGIQTIVRPDEKWVVQAVPKVWRIEAEGREDFENPCDDTAGMIKTN